MSKYFYPKVTHYGDPAQDEDYDIEESLDRFEESFDDEKQD